MQPYRGQTMALTRGVITMTAQIDKKSRGLMNNMAVQMAVLAIVAAVVIIIAAKYIW